MCFTKCNSSTKNIGSKESNTEGYIILDVKTFTSVNSDGVFQNALSGNDSTQSASNRRMYLQNNCLIDIVVNEHYNKES